MRGFKRLAIVATSALTLGTISMLAAAVSVGGSGTLRSVAAGAAQLLAANPAIDANAGGGGGGGVASNTGGATISVGPTATLTDRILIHGSVTFSCGPLLMFSFFGPSGFVTGPGNVQVQQAAGRDVAFAGGSFSVTCDGLTHTVGYSATAFNFTFHPGGAVADAQFGSPFFGGQFCGINPSTFQFQCVSADSGLTPITIVAR